MMPVKVRIQNCQSIKDSEILVDGFTVITGPNNSGKTASQRAIKGVFTNAPAGALVRHGESHLTVSLDFDQGGSLVWEKGASINQYTVDGKVLANVGRGVPDEVAAFGVHGLEVGRETVWPQIASQFAGGQFSGPVFLLDRPGSLLAEVVADVERIGKLSSALSAAEKDKRAATSNLKVRRKDLAALEEELAAYDGLDTATDAVDTLESKLETLDALRAEIEGLKLLRDRLAALQAQVGRLQGVGDISLPSPSSVEECSGLRVEIQEVSNLRTRRTALRAVVTALTGVGNVVVPSRERLTEVATVKTAMDQALALSRRHRQCRDRVTRYEGIERVNVPNAGAFDKASKINHALSLLVPLRNRHREALASVAVWEPAAQAACGVSLDVDAALVKAEKVRKGLERMRALQGALLKARAGLSALEDSLSSKRTAHDQASSQLSDLLDEIEACPACQTPMGETHLHKTVVAQEMS